MAGKRIPYPPCSECDCTGSACQGFYPPDAKKYEWPELVGVQGEVAKAQIERDNPYVNVFVIRVGSVVVHNICCNRVWVYVDDNHIVVRPPKVG
ncbi:Proteinase inhibitor I13 [Macleaya cordata]|uniref:Proteinase inhibitor I13 n=1 Tax=Macleaya cordata TaxID=56857 RepID=A0A200QGG3_MACCD|nr:Proteinase inhibitor I13 [Macleaya cordata]